MRSAHSTYAAMQYRNPPNTEQVLNPPWFCSLASLTKNRLDNVVTSTLRFATSLRWKSSGFRAKWVVELWKQGFGLQADLQIGSIQQLWLWNVGLRVPGFVIMWHLHLQQQDDDTQRPTLITYAVDSTTLRAVHQNVNTLSQVRRGTPQSLLWCSGLNFFSLRFTSLILHFKILL